MGKLIGWSGQFMVEKGESPVRFHLLASLSKGRTLLMCTAHSIIALDSNTVEGPHLFDTSGPIQQASNFPA